MRITTADNCNFMASAFSENAVNPLCDMIFVILGFRSVNRTQLVNIQSCSTKSYSTKNRILSTKDTRRVKVSILVVFRMGAIFTSGLFQCKMC